MLPSDGMTGYVGSDDMEAVTGGYTECSETRAEVVKTIESKGSFEHSIQSRYDTLH